MTVTDGGDDAGLMAGREVSMASVLAIASEHHRQHRNSRVPIDAADGLWGATVRAGGHICATRARIAGTGNLRVRL